MEVKEITELLREFVQRHRAAFTQISQRESQLLELAAIVAVERHYQSNGYIASVRAPIESKGKTFVVKLSTRGHPARYSRIVLRKDDVLVELHMNVMVRSAHDQGTYCVDVGVVQPGVIPDRAERKRKWLCVENADLITFAEVKRLVVYPMLLAQFIGIVHEIKPMCLRTPRPQGFGREEHLPPALLTLGRFSGNSEIVVSGFEERGFTVHIAENLDIRIAAHRRGVCRSPLYWDAPAG